MSPKPAKAPPPTLVVPPVPLPTARVPQSRRRSHAELRAAIDIREQFLRQAHRDSREYWRLHEQIAELDRELHNVTIIEASTAT